MASPWPAFPQHRGHVTMHRQLLHLGMFLLWKLPAASHEACMLLAVHISYMSSVSHSMLAMAVLGAGGMLAA